MGGRVASFEEYKLAVRAIQYHLSNPRSTRSQSDIVREYGLCTYVIAALRDQGYVEGKRAEAKWVGRTPCDEEIAELRDAALVYATEANERARERKAGFVPLPDLPKPAPTISVVPLRPSQPTLSVSSDDFVQELRAIKAMFNELLDGLEARYLEEETTREVFK